jgi:hypothetical protein
VQTCRIEPCPPHQRGDEGLIIWARLSHNHPHIVSIAPRDAVGTRPLMPLSGRALMPMSVRPGGCYRLACAPDDGPRDPTPGENAGTRCSPEIRVH